MQTIISTKGQIVLPKALRERYGWAPGTKLSIEDTPGGIVLRPAARKRPTTLAEVSGMLKPYYSGPAKTIEEMDAAITEEVKRRRADGRY